MYNQFTLQAQVHFSAQKPIAAQRRGGFSANSRDKRRIHDSKVKYVFAENRGAFVGGEYGLPGAIPILVNSSCAASYSEWAGAASWAPLPNRDHPSCVCRCVTRPRSRTFSRNSTIRQARLTGSI